MGLSRKAIIPLMEAANSALAGNTWKSYSTAVNHISRAEKAMGVSLTFPFTLTSTLAYVSYLLAPKSTGGRGLKGKTAEHYLSAIRMAHMERGFFNPVLKQDIIELITRGAENRDAVKARMSGKGSRQAMTPALMLVLKRELSTSTMAVSHRRLVWVVSCFCWAGALRIHEVLSREKVDYDPNTTFLGLDIKEGRVKMGDEIKGCLTLTLRHPKEARLSMGVKIDLFETGGFMCPVGAYWKWKGSMKLVLNKSKPLFRERNGECYTGVTFNKDLRILLGNQMDYTKGNISSHSFRAGIATWMAAKGYPDENHGNREMAFRCFPEIYQGAKGGKS